LRVTHPPHSANPESLTRQAHRVFVSHVAPGAGPALGPRLLTAFGTDRERFEDAGELCALSGTAPVRKASGKKTGKKAAYTSVTLVRSSCALRQSFYEFSLHSIGSCPWAKALYDSLRDRGKGHHAAVRAVSFKWIRILFACWKQRVPYDPERYLQALRTRGSAYAQAHS
jgi:hypothetical protein